MFGWEQREKERELSFHVIISNYSKLQTTLTSNSMEVVLDFTFIETRLTACLRINPRQSFEN